jgi:hypothetical protein
MKSSFNVSDSRENPATLSPISYPSSIKFGGQNKKAEKPESKPWLAWQDKRRLKAQSKKL